MEVHDERLIMGSSVQRLARMGDRSRGDKDTLRSRIERREAEVSAVDECSHSNFACISTVRECGYSPEHYADRDLAMVQSRSCSGAMHGEMSLESNF